MHSVAVALALVTVVLNALAALVGAWAWQRFAAPRAFWIGLRAGQGAAVAQALFAGIAAAAGSRPDDGLYWLYALLPVAIGFVAEQLRLVSAEQVLENRGLPDARAVGALPEAEQRSIVLSVVRREMGVMALAALVVALLALRAAFIA